MRIHLCNSNRAIIRVLSLGIFASASWTPIWLLADEQAAAAPPAREIVSMMIAERNRLNTGIFRVSGTKKIQSEKSSVEGDVTGYCAVDYSKGRFRYENREPFDVTLRQTTANKQHERQDEQLEPIPDGANADVGSRATRIREWKGIRTADAAIDWYRTGNDAWNDIIIGPPNPKGQFKSRHHPFDVRAVGLFTLTGFMSASPLEDAARAFPPDAAEIVDPRDGSLNVTLAWQKEHAVIRLVVDVLHGLTPRRLEVFHDRSATQAPDGSPPMCADARWTRINDVWVPIYFRVSERDDSREEIVWYALDLEWEQVNEPISDDVFSYRSFNGIPDGTYVRDVRRGTKEPIMIEIIGQPVPVTSIPPQSDLSPASRWRTLIAVNAVILAILGLILLWRKARMRKVQ